MSGSTGSPRPTSCASSTTRGGSQSTFPIRHTADGFAKLIRRLGKLGDRADVSVGIERPDGRLVDALLEAGHPVVR
jgi:hypothetical protein